METHEQTGDFREPLMLTFSSEPFSLSGGKSKMVDKKTYDGEVRRVQDLLDQIAKCRVAESPHAHVRLWFRGQPKCGWPLQPAVYRPGFPVENEDERLQTERHMTQDFRVQAAGLLTGRETEADLYFLQQHYRMPTRLLDWTNSPLPALYFAVTSNNDSDGELFMMDAYQLSPSQKAVDFEGIATARNATFEKALHPIFRWQKPDSFPDFIIPVRPDHLDHRMSLQRSCFTLHVPKRHVLTKEENKSLLSFCIPKDDKEHMKKELSLLGIDAFSVYGDLENLSRRLKTVYGIP
jgi:FRG domain